MNLTEFEKLVDKSDVEGCWNWRGRLSDKGYGKLRVDGKLKRAHRWAYELHHGPFDSALSVCHRCDNPSCVNPSHLFLGTHQDNMSDRRSKGRYHISVPEESIPYILSSPKLNRELAEEFGVNHSVMGKIRRAKSRNHEDREAQPKRNTKLTAEQVREILSTGQRGTDLAKKFGVTPQAISRIRRKGGGTRITETDHG